MSRLPGSGRFPAPTNLKAIYRNGLVRAFHRYYHQSGVWKHTSWLGVPAWESAGDMIALQQVIVDTRPDLVVETGTLFGGSALMFATVMDAIDHGEVLTVDIDHSRVYDLPRRHPRITLLTGSSADAATQSAIRDHAVGKRTMLFLDGDHAKSTVLSELRGLGDLVAPDCYCVVADTDHNHPVPVRQRGYEGPWEAVEAFLGEDDSFVADTRREYQLVTFFPNGWLRKVE